jgi:hypothetical protein
VAYLAALEQVLVGVPAGLVRTAVDELEEEFSWLDSRGTTALLAMWGSPRQAAERIVRDVG